MWNMSLAQPSDGGPGDQSQRDTGVGVLDRTMTVLEAVERGARSFTQIVEATGFTRSTTHRLVKALEGHGLLMSAGGRGYRLGPRLLGLAAAAMRDLPLRDVAHPALERLAEPPPRAPSSTCATATGACASTPWSPRTSSGPSWPWAPPSR